MNNLSGSGVTNSLLAIIAILLLVLVVQNASHPQAPFGAMPMGADNTMPPGHGHMAMGNAPQAQGQEGEQFPPNYNPTEMIYSALRCPSNPSITLGDPSCEGAEVSKRKKAVDDAYNQGLPMRQIFDAMIKKYGENALTDQALEIRRARHG